VRWWPLPEAEVELNHQFSVPTGVEETWAHFEDIASVADCFPGATVTSVEGSTFAGTCKVKLGPIALLYTGSGTFTEKDEAAHRFVVDAKGKDKRGNGTAGATVTLGMVPGASGGTDVSVHTDLAITGKPAQFGRGVMQDVSDKLLGQFVACLEHRLGAGVTPGEGGEPQTAAAAGSVPPTAAAAPEPVAEPAASDDTEPTTEPRTEPVAEPVSARPHTTPPPMAAAPPRQDALDLGATVLPILVKTYWKQALVVLVVIAVVVWLLVG
jgi:carbon monoxide dehydrogenase subunit G